MAKRLQILLVDNYDSFTYNLYQLFCMFPVNVRVLRNDNISFDKIEKKQFDIIVISPGPGTPSDAGFSKTIISKYHKIIPILGVCLGMQSINEVFGGRTIPAPVPVHGKTSLIYHNRHPIFSCIDSPFRVARYHSLICGNIPNCLEIIAKTKDGIAMAFAHKELPIFGLQFHPESFLCEGGPQIAKNFLYLLKNTHGLLATTKHESHK